MKWNLHPAERPPGVPVEERYQSRPKHGGSPISSQYLQDGIDKEDSCEIENAAEYLRPPNHLLRQRIDGRHQQSPEWSSRSSDRFMCIEGDPPPHKTLRANTA